MLMPTHRDEGMRPARRPDRSPPVAPGTEEHRIFGAFLRLPSALSVRFVNSHSTASGGESASFLSLRLVVARGSHWLAQLGDAGPGFPRTQVPVRDATEALRGAHITLVETPGEALRGVTRVWKGGVRSRGIVVVWDPPP